MIKVLIVILCLLFSSMVYANPVLITEEYTVQEEDNLDTITIKFSQKANITNPTAIKAFREGIIEINYPLLKGRDKHEVLTNDIILINYWKNI